MGAQQAKYILQISFTLNCFKPVNGVSVAHFGGQIMKCAYVTCLPLSNLYFLVLAE